MLPIVEGCGSEMLQAACKWKSFGERRAGGHHTIGPGTTNICTFVVLYIYIHIYIYIVIYIYIYMIIDIYIYLLQYIYIHDYIYVYIQVCVCVHSSTTGISTSKRSLSPLKKKAWRPGLVKMVWVNLRTRIASSTTIMAWDSAGMMGWPSESSPAAAGSIKPYNQPELWGNVFNAQMVFFKVCRWGVLVHDQIWQNPCSKVSEVVGFLTPQQTIKWGIYSIAQGPPSIVFPSKKPNAPSEF